MVPTLRQKRKAIPVARRLAKTIRRRKNPLKKRIEARARALKISRIRCRREKQVKRAEFMLKGFETALASLEKDPAAIKLFRGRRIPKLKKRVEALNFQISLVEAEARKCLPGNIPTASKLWRKANNLERKKKALIVELRMLENLV